PMPAASFRLSERSRQEYLRPQVTREERTSPVHVVSSNSLGWMVANVEGFTFFSHAGEAAGWNCEAMASVSRKSGLIIMANGDSFLPFREKLKLNLEFHQQLFAV